MKRASLSVFLMMVTNQAFAEALPVDQKMAEARLLTKAFGADMKKALKTAVAKDGMAGAIETCGHISPEVAASHSQNGWHVGRTSQRVRNSQNQPDTWESNVLANFSSRHENGESFNQMEFGEWVKGEYRYMKAIPTQPFCISCHGSNILPNVKTAIEANYPEDKATAFKVGDLRGAFSLRWKSD